MSTARRFHLIGPGRAGSSLRGALSDVGWECARTFHRGDDLGDAALGVDACIVATPDQAIVEVARRINPGNAVVMHLSGATPLAALGTSNQVAALHPLQSLPNPEVGRVALRSAYFAVAGEPVAREMAEALSGNWFEIADTDRALYHCAAAIASNHTTALLGQVERLATAIGVPFEAFAPLVNESLANVWELGPASALTGPASRGDTATIDSHRQALDAHDPREQASYEALVELAERLAGRLGDHGTDSLDR